MENYLPPTALFLVPRRSAFVVAPSPALPGSVVLLASCLPNPAELLLLGYKILATIPIPNPAVLNAMIPTALPIVIPTSTLINPAAPSASTVAPPITAFP